MLIDIHIHRHRHIFLICSLNDGCNYLTLQYYVAIMECTLFLTRACYWRVRLIHLYVYVVLPLCNTCSIVHVHCYVHVHLCDGLVLMWYMYISISNAIHDGLSSRLFVIYFYSGITGVCGIIQATHRMGYTTFNGQQVYSCFYRGPIGLGKKIASLREQLSGLAC